MDGFCPTKYHLPSSFLNSEFFYIHMKIFLLCRVVYQTVRICPSFLYVYSNAFLMEYFWSVNEALYNFTITAFRVNWTCSFCLANWLSPLFLVLFSLQISPMTSGLRTCFHSCIVRPKCIAKKAAQRSSFRNFFKTEPNG